MKSGAPIRIATAVRTQNIEGPTLINLIGLAIAYAAPTPKSSEDSITDFWIRNLSTRVNEIISEIGEHLVFNTPMTAAVAKEAYANRVAAFRSPLQTQPQLTADWTPLTISAYRQVHTVISAEFGVVVGTSTEA